MSRRFFQVTSIFLLLFMVQIAIYSFHEFSEAGVLPNSQVLHEATEPFSPTGIYGSWFSAIAIGALRFGWRQRGSAMPSRKISRLSSVFLMKIVRCDGGFADRQNFDAGGFHRNHVVDILQPPFDQ